MAEYLNTWLRTKIHDERTLLMEITPKTPLQEIAHRRYIRRLNVLDLYGNTDPLDTEVSHENNTDAMELKDLKASIFNIEHETSAVYMQSTRTQETLNIGSTLPRIIQPHPETSIEDKLNNIETRLKKMETAKEEANSANTARKLES